MNPLMTTQPAMASFTPMEWYALTLVRRRFHANRDLFTLREQASLTFMRWLVTETAFTR
jgi:hypothetical protein